MEFQETKIHGLYVVDVERHEDERGFFGRTWCANEFAAHGLPARMVQESISFNKNIGTLRGMHYQIPPSMEGKLVRCVTGRIFDVVVDLRADSGTFLEWYSIELNADSYRALFVPPGFAHGFQTLETETHVQYMMSDFYQPSDSVGFRWNDLAFNIKWPMEEKIVLERDQSYPDFDMENVRNLEWI